MPSLDFNFFFAPAQFTEDHQDLPYDSFNIVTEYDWNEGLLQIPVGEAPAEDSQTAGANRVSCEIARCNAPHGFKRVSWVATRMGCWPACPHPLVFGNSNEVFSHSRITVKAPQVLDPSRQRTWEISGVYTYILQKPIWAEDGLPSGATPYVTDDASVTTYPGMIFQKDLTPGVSQSELRTRPDLTKRPI